MVESKILDEKPDFFGEDGRPIKDLFVPTFDLPEDGFRFRVMRVTKEIAFRPLLCVQTAYDDTSGWDLFLKINNVSNPFDIQRGDILIIPEERSLKRMKAKPSERSRTSVADSESEERSKSRAKRDNEDRKEYLKNREKNSPTSGTGDEGIEFNDDAVVIDVDEGLDAETQNLRKNVLKKALAKANKEGNTVLSKQIAKLLKCE